MSKEGGAGRATTGKKELGRRLTFVAPRDAGLAGAKGVVDVVDGALVVERLAGARPAGPAEDALFAQVGAANVHPLPGHVGLEAVGHAVADEGAHKLGGRSREQGGGAVSSGVAGRCKGGGARKTVVQASASTLCRPLSHVVLGLGLDGDEVARHVVARVPAGEEERLHPRLLDVDQLVDVVVPCRGGKALGEGRSGGWEVSGEAAGVASDGCSFRSPLQICSLFLFSVCSAINSARRSGRDAAALSWVGG